MSSHRKEYHHKLHLRALSRYTNGLRLRYFPDERPIKRYLLIARLVHKVPSDRLKWGMEAVERDVENTIGDDVENDERVLKCCKSAKWGDLNEWSKIYHELTGMIFDDNEEEEESASIVLAQSKKSRRKKKTKKQKFKRFPGIRPLCDAHQSSLLPLTEIHFMSWERSLSRHCNTLLSETHPSLSQTERLNLIVEEVFKNLFRRMRKRGANDKINHKVMVHSIEKHLDNTNQEDDQKILKKKFGEGLGVVEENLKEAGNVFMTKKGQIVDSSRTIGRGVNQSTSTPRSTRMNISTLSSPYPPESTPSANHFSTSLTRSTVSTPGARQAISSPSSRSSSISSSFNNNNNIIHSFLSDLTSLYSLSRPLTPHVALFNSFGIKDLGDLRILKDLLMAGESPIKRLLEFSKDWKDGKGMSEVERMLIEKGLKDWEGLK